VGNGPAQARWTARIACDHGLNPEQLDAIPASHGVVCISEPGGDVLALASTGDMRSFAAQRVGPQAEGTQDCRASAGLVELAPAGSMFEADLVFMDAARERDPGLHDRVTRKLRVWWLATSGEARRFGWSWSSDPAELEPGSVVIGPFLEKSGARHHAEWLDARFELCRYPEELRRVPAGKACVYKQMGKCPGACEGAETLGAYEARLGEALSYGRAHAERELELLDAEMRAAAARHSFERAAELKAQREALAKELSRGLRSVRRLGEVSFVAVATSGRAGEACVIAVDRGRWAVVGVVDARGSAQEAEASAKAARERLAAMRDLEGVGDLGVLGVVSRELMRPSRGGPELIELGEATGERLLHAAGRVLRIRPAGAKGPGVKGSDRDA